MPIPRLFRLYRSLPVRKTSNCSPYTSPLPANGAPSHFPPALCPGKFYPNSNTQRTARSFPTLLCPGPSSSSPFTQHVYRAPWKSESGANVLMSSPVRVLAPPSLPSWQHLLCSPRPSTWSISCQGLCRHPGALQVPSQVSQKAA